MIHPPAELGGYVVACFSKAKLGTLDRGTLLEHTPKEIRAFNYGPLTLRRPSVPDTVFARLVREGLAVLVGVGIPSRK